MFSNRDQRTLPKKFLSLVETLGIEVPVYLVADAYYACHTVALGLTAAGSHLVSRLRKNAVAFEPVPTPTAKRKRGRPRLYGPKIRLFTLFETADAPWATAESPVYGEKGVRIRYLCLDLVWKPIRQLARFVLVNHPTRGRIILLATDLTMHPVEVIRLYGLRFKIELSFKQAVRTLGVYAYHFWMMIMDKIGRRSGESVSASQKCQLPQRHATQARRLSSPYPDRPHRPGHPTMPGRDRFHARLVQLRLLAVHHPAGDPAFGAGRHDRHAQRAPGISRRFWSSVNIQEIHPRPHRPQQGRGFTPRRLSGVSGSLELSVLRSNISP